MAHRKDQQHAEVPRPRSLAEVEREAIVNALKYCDNNRTQAARLLGVSVRTVQRKAKQYGIKWTPSAKPPV